MEEERGVSEELDYRMKGSDLVLLDRRKALAPCRA